MIVNKVNCKIISTVPRPSLPAFNVARNKARVASSPGPHVARSKREEGLVRDVTHVMQRVDSI